MDPIALIFYALICAVLSLFSPRLGTPTARLAAGAAVGVVAAAALPSLRALIGV